MKLFKEIAGRVMALWAILMFAIGILVIVIPSWLVSFFDEPKRTRYSFFFYRAWLTFFFIFSGVRREIRGKEHFKKGQTYVVVTNHRSLLDPPLSCPAIPGANKTIAKIEMAKIPVFNVIYKGGSVLVDRKSDESRRRSYIQMKEVLAMGLHMSLYPEGTRNKSKEPLQRFYDGAFKLAIESGKDVIPGLLFDTEKVLPPKPFFFWPRKVRLHFLPAVSSAGKTPHELKMEVFNIMKTYYEQNQ